MVWTGALEKTTESDSPGKLIYTDQCAVCHQDDLSGAPPDIPALGGVGRRLSQEAIAERIRRGGGRMPAYTSFTPAQLTALVHFLAGIQDKADLKKQGNAPPAKFHFTGYREFYDPDGYPAVLPPWGTLNAIDLNTGKYVWKIPFGEYPALAAEGLRNTGTENYGGAVVTAGGLLFIGATNFDNKFHAFDAATGKLLWEITLPFAGNATPATYEADGRQYVVIAAGGGKGAIAKGGVYMAFAVPR